MALCEITNCFNEALCESGNAGCLVCREHFAQFNGPQNRGSHNPFDHPRNPNDNLMKSDSPAPDPTQGNAPASDPRIDALLKRIESDFSYHSPKGDQAERYALIRDTAKRLARVMAENCPQSRELSSALTRLEEAVMHANASIARNE